MEVTCLSCSVQLNMRFMLSKKASGKCFVCSLQIHRRFLMSVYQYKQLDLLFLCSFVSNMVFCVYLVVPNSTKQADEERKFQDCADLYQAGFQKNGVYTINISPQETRKVGILFSHQLCWKNTIIS